MNSFTRLTEKCRFAVSEKYSTSQFDPAEILELIQWKELAELDVLDLKLQKRGLRFMVSSLESELERYKTLVKLADNLATSAKAYFETEVEQNPTLTALGYSSELEAYQLARSASYPSGGSSIGGVGSHSTECQAKKCEGNGAC